MVLQGAKNIIKNIRPKFYVEVGSDVSRKTIQLFQSAGYVAFDSLGNELTDSCAPNTFFFPEEHQKSEQGKFTRTTKKAPLLRRSAFCRR